MNKFFRVLLFIGLFIYSYPVYAGMYKFEAESGVLLGGSSLATDSIASGGKLVSLAELGQGLKFTNMPKSTKFAISYASVNVGTVSVKVGGQPVRKINVHSSGDAKGYYLNAILDIEIPAGSELVIAMSQNDVAVNIDTVTVGDGDLGLPPDIWNLPDLTVAQGPFPADWEGISRLYSVPDWWREAKFGAWSHWTPQSMPEQGDWYARGMYMQGHAQYEHHVKTFGHPSEYGYKDICNDWEVDRWDPEELMDLFVEMGAKYFMAMGVHHDNFDCWDSAYQPWNSVEVGPKVDIVGIWEKQARKHGLKFGIGFHNTPGRTWGQFMTVRYTSDRNGPKQGVPYDAMQTIKDGKGKWWEGMDPVDLYGPPHKIDDPLYSPYANQFMWRIDDAISKYQPDMIYFDEHAGNSQFDLGVRMGLGFLAPKLIANYYNKSLQWNSGQMDVVINLKGVGGRYNSFQDKPELLPKVDMALVKSTEAIIEPEITAYPFQTETSIADWHYKTGQQYMTARKAIELLMQNVSRNGTMLLNLTQHARGDLDSELITICKDIGIWLKANGEAVYGSRPFEVHGDDNVCYTRNNGMVYATVMNWRGGDITLKALHSGGATIGKVSKVEIIGSDQKVDFVQDQQGLIVTPVGPMKPLAGVADNNLANGCRVLRITHDKGWFNDDDPGVRAPGWSRSCNLGTGDYNNDLTISETAGDVWRAAFEGSVVSIVAPKEQGFGKIQVVIDGKIHGIADLATSGDRLAQQKVFSVTDLAKGEHKIEIINLGSGKVAIDALVID